MTTAQTTVTNKPDWVSYFIKNPATGNFDHTTYFAVPANTKVNVTILGLRRLHAAAQPGLGAGRRDDRRCRERLVLQRQDATPAQPVTTFDSWANCSVQHTFAIPGLGINVPVASPTDGGREQRPVRHRALRGERRRPRRSAPHTVVTFSFTTPKTAGTYRWQCFVPCGGGYVDGNGGPMATPGYMMGQMEVQA